MRLPKFDYVEPGSVKEASSILLQESASRILAGGTDLLVNMKHRVEVPSIVVNIKRISGLDFIRQDNGALSIGALTPLKKIYSTPLVGEKVLALALAASSVGSYHHQIMGTIGGNLCQQNRCKFFNQSQWWRSSRPTCFKAGGEICHVVNKKEACFSAYCGDIAPVLLVMDARVVLAGLEGSREISIEDLYSGDGKVPLTLAPGEILTEIIISREAMEGVSTYAKFANRESIDFPIVGAAFWASTEKGEYRVAFTAVDCKPIRGRQVEKFLKGRDMDEELMEEVCDLAAKEAQPVKTSLYSPSYKRRMMGLLLQSAVRQSIGRVKQ